MASASDPITVKLYANRRLYRPETGAYVLVEDLISYVRNGFDIVVRDAATGADITQFILDQSLTEH
jgi:polyhydroxyalkanoate synthesis regulator protein